MPTLTEVRERPILFSGPMIRALLDGRKSQTRRVVKPQPGGLGPSHWYRHETEGWWTCGDNTGTTWRCPYGAPGDRLWVREAFIHEPADYCWEASVSIPSRPASTVYRADFPDSKPGEGWKPSIHMPRTLSRLTLEITGVRVERVQEISDADARAEGTDWAAPQFYDGQCHEPDEDPREVGFAAGGSFARDNFARLWDHINASRGFGWDANPWVWVVEFRPTTPEGES